MPTTGGLPQPRRKVVTYGRAKRAPFNPLGFESPSPQKFRPRGSATERARSPSPARSSHVGHNGASTQAAPEDDVFDAPLADDEGGQPASKAVRMTTVTSPRPQKKISLPEPAVVVVSRPKPQQHATQQARPPPPDVFDVPGSDDEERGVVPRSKVAKIDKSRDEVVSRPKIAASKPIASAKVSGANGRKANAPMDSSETHTKEGGHQTVPSKPRSQLNTAVVEIPSRVTEGESKKRNVDALSVSGPGRVKQNPDAQKADGSVYARSISTVQPKSSHEKGSTMDRSSTRMQQESATTSESRALSTKLGRANAKESTAHKPSQKTKSLASTISKSTSAVPDASVFDVPTTDTEDETAKQDSDAKYTTTPKVKKTIPRARSQQPEKGAQESRNKRRKPSPNDEQETSRRQQVQQSQSNGVVAESHSQKNSRIAQHPRRAGLTGAARRKPPVKASSSPAKLQIPVAPNPGLTNMHEPEASGPYDVEFETEINPYAAAYQDSGSPMHLDGAGSATPKQKRLWSNLLGDNVATPSPSQLKLQKLQLTERPEKRKSPETLSGATNLDTRQGKRRLIDRLIQSEEEASEDSSSGDESFHSVPTEPISSQYDSSQISDPPALMRQTSSFRTKRSGPTGARITYAKQRSHLEESMVEDGDILGAITMGSPTDMKPSAKSWSQPLISRSGDTSHFDMDDDDLSDSGAGMKSIHELRIAGANRQFSNEVDALFEDLDQPKKASLSSRRSALINLGAKLTDKRFVSKLLDKGLSRRIFNAHVADYSQDPILGFAFSACVAFILTADKSTAVLADIRESGTLECLASLLDRTDDIAHLVKARRTNMSRIAQKAVMDLHEIVRSSTHLWAVASSTSISPRLLALRGLELSTRSLRKAGDRDELLTQDHLAKVLAIAETSSSGSATGSVSPLDQRCVYYSLSVALDTTLGDTASEVWSTANQHRFRDIAASFLDTPPRFGPKVEQLATKLCLNLTNNNAHTSALFASPVIIQSFLCSIDSRFNLLSSPLSPADRSIAIDHLVLGLGAMINLAEFSDAARLAVLAPGDVLLNALLRIHLEGAEKVAEADSLEESNANVAFGYLSVLLANLCLNETVRGKVRGKMPQGGLEGLVGALAQFVGLQVMACRLEGGGAGAGGGEDEGREVWASQHAAVSSQQASKKESHLSNEKLSSWCSGLFVYLASLVSLR
ncbi:hypothetical protein EJ05DRAFT_487846 [Pseudovirgaria hyperparasitica]|uniref:Wings apart-like protein C-terminal domain-containing protein n=1 Tax=Pseudovirgaria hyperparasitica TaxID=470096 RepID=A0A6A6VZE1_9PEZI|nr:uncharacterized protein EJ05DRAFT_487846 [Pseudovirgaria hyperparasitica]KAF2756038.1 hypothetical protein EJ05DRAFT_487846 [Pseudovirgaria hyperparasitica]